MAREIHCKTCQQPFGSVFALTKHKRDDHGEKPKRKKKVVEETPPLDGEIELITNCVSWFDAAHDLAIAIGELVAPELLGHYSATGADDT